MCVYTDLEKTQGILFSTSRLIGDMSLLLRDAERQLKTVPNNEDAVQTASTINEFLRDME
jgi:hypothetical protein